MGAPSRALPVCARAFLRITLLIIKYLDLRFPLTGFFHLAKFKKAMTLTMIYLTSNTFSVIGNDIQSHTPPYLRLCFGKHL